MSLAQFASSFYHSYSVRKCLLLIYFLSGRNLFSLSLVSSFLLPLGFHLSSFPKSYRFFSLWFSSIYSLKLLSCWERTRNSQKRNISGHTFTNRTTEVRAKHLPWKDFPWVEMCLCRTSHSPSAFSVSLVSFFQWLLEVKNACEFNWVSCNVSLNGRSKAGRVTKELRG